MEVLEAIRSRRSIRKFKPDAIDEKALNTMLEAARLAPSWSNVQCWRFVVVTASEIKSQLAATLTSDNPAANAVRQAPVVIVACAERNKSGYYHGQPSTDKGDWCMFDVALAMENLVLAAQSLGLGSVHVGLFDAKKAAGVIEVPEGFSVIEMVPLGYPDQVRDPRPRKDISEIVYYNKFGKK